MEALKSLSGAWEGWLHQSKFRMEDWKIKSRKKGAKAAKRWCDRRRAAGVESLKSLSASMGRALLYKSAVVFSPFAYSHKPMKMWLIYNFCLSKTRLMSIFYFFSPQLPPCPGGEAARPLIRSTRVPFIQIVIHQTEEQVLTNKGIQENTWEVVGGLSKWCWCYLWESSRVPSGHREASLSLFQLTDLWIWFCFTAGVGSQGGLDSF